MHRPEAVGVVEINAERGKVKVGRDEIGVLLGEIKGLFHKTDGLRPHFGQLPAFLRGKGEHIRGKQSLNFLDFGLRLSQNIGWYGLDVDIFFHSNLSLTASGDFS